jgi:hypothetical protein
VKDFKKILKYLFGTVWHCTVLLSTRSRWTGHVLAVGSTVPKAPSVRQFKLNSSLYVSGPAGWAGAMCSFFLCRRSKISKNTFFFLKSIKFKHAFTKIFALKKSKADIKKRRYEQRAYVIESN